MPLSSALTEAVNAQDASLVVCMAITVEHASLATPLRFTSNGEDIVIGGDTYTALAMEVEKPSEVEEGVPTCALVLDNTDQSLTPLLRSISGELTVTVQEVRCTNRAATPPVFAVEITYLPFTLSEVDLDENSARLSLTYDNGLNTEFPADDFTPTDFPGLF